MTLWRYAPALGAVLGIAFFTVPLFSSAQTADSFSTTWNTENTGTSNDDQITIPTTGGGYNYDVYWEQVASSTINGSSTGHTGGLTITFPEPGIYRVDISGTFPRIYFNNGGDKEKILTVEQWGNIAWSSMDRAFFGASNLTIPAADAPDLSSVTSFGNMFNGASTFNESIDHWDVSNVTSMGSMFKSASAFNQPLNSWDVSNVTNMSQMFRHTSSFNQPLDNWDVSSVTGMHRMFEGTDFNQPINSWNVGNVTDMVAMFQSTPFNQPLDQWDVSSVTTMSSMFKWMGFNQDISSWDVSNVSNFNSMFQGNGSFNQPLNSWDVSGATTLEGMFVRARSFNQPLDQWDTSNVTNMRAVFHDGLGWHGWSPADMSFNQDISAWDTSKVTNFNLMFQGNEVFDQDISSWNTASATNMSEMFKNATAFDQDLSSWNVVNVTTMEDMFLNKKLSGANLDATLESWASQSVESDVPLHIGGKTYSATGSTAIQTLENTYNWDITEQYVLTYGVGTDASLIGDGTQFVASGNDGTEVEVRPDGGHRFVEWSDGSSENPRTDTNVAGNINVSAVIESIGGDKIELSDSDGAATNTQQKRSSASSSLEETLEHVKGLSEKPLPPIDPERDRDIVVELIKTLLELVKALTMLLTENGSAES